jgi:outer membrane protein OmpA-like peptidoglycan-associated protein
MTGRALKTALSNDHVTDPEVMRPDNPAIPLLEAMRNGDEPALLAAVTQSTTVTAENMPWACRGPDEIQTMLREVRDRFPGLVFESSTRHIGFGLVIEEARVRDTVAEAAAASRSTGSDAQAAQEDAAAAEVDEQSHPMWDQPAVRRTSATARLGGAGDADLGPVPLNMPVRVTVKHDDLQVHEVRLSFPAALLKRALGQEVDPLEVSLSEVQSAFIAPVGAGFTTHSLARPDLTAVPPSVADRGSPVERGAAEPPRRRRRYVVPLLVLVALVASAGWWFTTQSDGGTSTASPRGSGTPTSPPSASASPRASAGSSASAKVPTVIRSESTSEPTRKPNVVLRSDLAFGFNSSTLSPAAKAAIDKVAREVRSAELSGRIYVDGYTDSIGSAAYGLVLSNRRALVVSDYLKTQLLGAPVSIAAVGHGESNPIASNATAAGRRQNRRVTITLPRG